MAKKGQRRLTSKEISLILALDKYGGAMNANQLVGATKLSYVTVQKYLTQLEKVGIVTMVTGKGQTKTKGKRSKEKRYSIDYERIRRETEND